MAFKIRKRTARERIDYLYNKIEADEIDNIGLAHFVFDRMIVEYLNDIGHNEVADKMECLIYDYFKYTEL